MPEFALQEVADPASDQIRTGSARTPARDAEPESHHSHDVHGYGGKQTHDQANNEPMAFHRAASLPLLVRLLPNEIRNQWIESNHGQHTTGFSFFGAIGIVTLEVARGGGAG